MAWKHLKRNPPQQPKLYKIRAAFLHPSSLHSDDGVARVAEAPTLQKQVFPLQSFASSWTAWKLIHLFLTLQGSYSAQLSSLNPLYTTTHLAVSAVPLATR